MAQVNTEPKARNRSKTFQDALQLVVRCAIRKIDNKLNQWSLGVSPCMLGVKPKAENKSTISSRILQLVVVKRFATQEINNIFTRCKLIDSCKRFVVQTKSTTITLARWFRWFQSAPRRREFSTMLSAAAISSMMWNLSLSVRQCDRLAASDLNLLTAANSLRQASDDEPKPLACDKPLVCDDIGPSTASASSLSAAAAAAADTVASLLPAVKYNNTITHQSQHTALLVLHV